MGLPDWLTGGRREPGGGGMGLPESLVGGRCGMGRRAGSPVGGLEGALGALGAACGTAGAAAAGAGGAAGSIGASALLGALGALGALSPLWALWALGAAVPAAGAGAAGLAPPERTRRRGGLAASSDAAVGCSVTSGSVGGAAGALAGALAAALAGSSGWTSRRSPSALALRRTRSACASSIEDEWLLMPMPSETARSTVSLFVIPSSLASS
jgi:hypothetical protein